MAFTVSLLEAAVFSTIIVPLLLSVPVGTVEERLTNPPLPFSWPPLSTVTAGASSIPPMTFTIPLVPMVVFGQSNGGTSVGDVQHTCCSRSADVESLCAITDTVGIQRTLGIYPDVDRASSTGVQGCIDRSNPTASDAGRASRGNRAVQGGTKRPGPPTVTRLCSIDEPLWLRFHGRSSLRVACASNRALIETIEPAPKL